MITLGEWFKQNAQRPLRSVGVIVLSLWIILTSFSLLRESEDQKEAFGRLLDVTGLALAQHNRILIESLLDSAQSQTGSYSVAICRGKDQIISARTRDSNCNVDSTIWLGTLSADIPGFSDHRLILRYNRYKQSFLQISFLTISLTLVGATLFLLKQIQFRVAREVIAPLVKGLLHGESMHILEFEDLRRDLFKAQEDRARNAAAEAVMHRNQQIAHDIRSPLSALRLLSKSFSTMAQPHRNVFDSAMERIQDIANSLVSSVKTGSVAIESGDNIFDWAALIKNAVAEKTIEFAHAEIKFESSTDRSNARSPILPDRIEMSRVLSNLMNNGAEAIGADRGRVHIGMRRYAKCVSITVSDDGKGMAPETLRRIGERGVSIGKPGTGLGLFHAKETVERYGGSLTINSKLGVGTQVILEFPTV